MTSLQILARRAHLVLDRQCHSFYTLSARLRAGDPDQTISPGHATDKIKESPAHQKTKKVAETLSEGMDHNPVTKKFKETAKRSKIGRLATEDTPLDEQAKQVKSGMDEKDRRDRGD